MKILKTALIASVMFVGVASANCCVTSCCETTCVRDVVKSVPYQVCVNIVDACGNVIGQKYVTKYKSVVVQEVVSCCN